MTRKNVTERSKAPEFVSNGGFIPTNEYNKWLKELKQRVRQLQTKAAVRINAGMLELYWSLGKDITRLKAEQIWGDGFFPRLSLDLRDEFPSIRGFSESNLRYIHRWYIFYNQPVSGESEIPHQLGEEFQMPEKFALVPWRHHIEIFTKSKGKEEALFYIDKVVEENWKVVDFMPEFAGKLNFYVSAVDELLRDSTDNPSIGLLICKDKDDTTVRWAFRGVTTPMGVATYELQEVLDDALAGKLPSIKEIEEAIDGGIEEM